MSVTPLHFGAASPLMRYIDFRAFVVTNILIDLEVVIAVVQENLSPYPLDVALHRGAHTLGGAIIIALLVMTCYRSMRAVYGALYGALSHILIDATYHADVAPFAFLSNNTHNPIHGVVPQVYIDCTLLLLCLPLAWQAYKWCRTKCLEKFC